MSLTAPGVEEMHRQLRKYYHDHGMDKPMPDYGRFPVTGIKDLEQAVRKAEQKSPLVNLPPGVHLLSGKRIGDEIRDGYLDHLRRLYSLGYLDGDEFEARQAAAMSARTGEELGILLKDLPALPPGKNPEPSVRTVFLRALSAGVVGFTCALAVMISSLADIPWGMMVMFANMVLGYLLLALSGKK